MLELIRQKMSAATLDFDDKPSTSTSSPLGTPCESLHCCVKLHAGHFKRLQGEIFDIHLIAARCSLLCPNQQFWLNYFTAHMHSPKYRWCMQLVRWLKGCFPCAGPLSEIGELRDPTGDTHSIYGDSDLMSSDGRDQVTYGSLSYTFFRGGCAITHTASRAYNRRAFEDLCVLFCLCTCVQCRAGLPEA